MPFEPVSQEKLSHGVVRQIEGLILRGILRPGERLPSERELSERMSVSRPSLREALSELQERGLLASKAGAGVYVADVLGSAFAPALVALFSTHDEAVFDYISFRRDMEGLAAERAARCASDTDLQVINAIFQKMEAAHQKRNPADEAHLDADFHLSIIEASHNIIMLHMMRSMYELLREGVFYNRTIMFKQRMTRDALLEHHRIINTALQNRDAAGARKAVETHLNFVEASLSDHKKSERNEVFAQKRLEHEGWR
ncbi:GntR family transcriptional regulator [Loktanella sp. 5RATIMAR09]|uniref:FadR/GntR family transcriptional regulator n=1 Tax=Loktanella sp. 5RATIMAR09 TaxID=1225655 RepID=UPI0006EBD1F4|nr:FCD domain-containing protein [Loktanella sp. 5RATIMAR09]KQI72287.1 GntR family transcriptional regulator [Loktanella sp. 5RATIMAR09]